MNDSLNLIISLLKQIGYGLHKDITLIDRDLNIVWVNESLEHKGFELDKIKGHFYQKCFEDKDEVDKHDPTYIAFTQQRAIKKMKRGLDGNFYSIFSFPMEKYVVEIVQNVGKEGKQVRDEETLTLLEDFKESNRRLAEKAAFVRNNPAPVFRASYDGRITSSNEATKTLFGKDIRESFLQDVFKEFSKHHLKTILEKNILQFESKIGDNYFLFTIRNSQSTSSIYIYGDDVSNLKKSQASINKRNKELHDALIEARKAERVKTEFLSITSHELRTPITPMKAQLQMILQGYFGKVTDEQKKSLQLVLNNAVHLDGLIGDILDVSKIESGNMKFMMSKYDLLKLAKEVAVNMRLKSKEKSIEIILETESIEPFVLDEGRVTQVFNNLINNAIKFTDEGGKIIVSVIDQKDKALVKIKDSGIGISKKDQSNLFKPFSQVDSSLSRNHEGTGLGLAIAKGIVEQHRGNIWIESEVGKGATFCFTLAYGLTEQSGVSKVIEDEKNYQESFRKAWDVS